MGQPGSAATQSDTEIKFNCTGCGLCCTRIKRVLDIKDQLPDPEIRKLLNEFPYKTRENGWCEKLDPVTMQCTVYETRPDVCRVNRVYERVHAAHLTRKQYYQMDEAACKKLQDEEQLTKATTDTPHQKV